MINSFERMFDLLLKINSITGIISSEIAYLPKGSLFFLKSLYAFKFFFFNLAKNYYLQFQKPQNQIFYINLIFKTFLIEFLNKYLKQI